MLKLEDLRTIFLLVSFVGALAISSPALAFVLPSRAGERFSELYILGPARIADDYPSSVEANETYRVFLGIGNHMGSSAYYVLRVKLRDRGEEIPIPLAPLYEYYVVLAESESWESPLDFSFNSISFSENRCALESLTIDGVAFSIDKSVLWDSESGGFFSELLFELWIYDAESRGFSYHDRFVGIWLNVTAY